MADGNIKLYGKLKSVTEEGKVADYSEIAGVPIIMQDLSASGFTPTANTYYLHIGETTIMCDKGTIYFYNGTEYKVLGSGGLSDDFGLAQGNQKYSIIQKRIKSDGTIAKTEAYQRGTAAFGGGTVAGDKNGLATDYSFAFAANENNKAIPRSSATFGRYNTAYNTGEFVCGDYASDTYIDENGEEKKGRNPLTVFAVGTGLSDSNRRTGFEVRKDGYCYSNGKALATEGYVDTYTVKKEGTSYVAYINEGDGKSAVMPYRFSKQSILDAEYTLMLQPMFNGRLYSRDPEDECHVANKRYVVAQDNAIKASLGTKLDKTGGMISGDLTIRGVLCVSNDRRNDMYGTYEFSEKVDGSYKKLFQIINGKVCCLVPPTQGVDVVRLKELNTKLNKPTNPTETSVITLTSTGTVGTKKVSDLGGSTLYSIVGYVKDADSGTPQVFEAITLSPIATLSGGVPLLAITGTFYKGTNDYQISDIVLANSTTFMIWYWNNTKQSYSGIPCSSDGTVGIANWTETKL